MSEPLSKVFGLERKYVISPISLGYNKALNSLNQLSPDVNKLKEILDYYNLPENGFYTDVIAQEIINKMSEWIKKP